jgi:hypothetical protein
MLPGRQIPQARASLAVCVAFLISACTGRIGETADRGGPGDAQTASGTGSAAGRGGAPGTAHDPKGAQGSDAGGSLGGDAGFSQPALNCDEPAVGATPLVRLNRGQYANAVRDLLSLSTPPDVSDLAEDERVGPFAGNTVAPVSELVVEQYMTTAETVARGAAANLAGLVSCDRAKLGEDACAVDFIARFGRRAYRRPLADDEKAVYHTLYSTYAKPGTTDGLRVVVQTMLASPNFLYHVELQPPAPSADAVAPLDAYELASRLSFFLLNTTPDDALLDAAAGFADTAVLRAQAERLLDDPRASDSLTSFHMQWLELDKLGTTSKSAAVYPAFDDALSAAMAQETSDFVQYVVQKSDAKLETLLTAPYSFPQGPLRALYGLGPASGADPTVPVALPPAERAGLLTQPGFLAVHAHSNQSAPVQRGKVVIRNILCEALPDPPPDVNTTPPDPSPNATTRERFAVHEQEARCAGCHKRIDGIGMGFENYDGIGAYRTKEGTLDVDASGELMLTRDIDGPFDGVVELAKKLASSEEVRECVVTQWLRFALGRFETPADRCSLSKLDDAFEASGHDVRKLLVSVVVSDAFRSKRVIKESAP